jgi:hypothetical protein
MGNAITTHTKIMVLGRTIALVGTALGTIDEPDNICN